MKKVAVFLGSGISFPSGIPSVDEITDSLFSKTWFRDTDETYYEGANPSPQLRKDYLADKQITFLKILESHVIYYYGNRRKHNTNYEDLYYLSRQLYEEEQSEIENPAIIDFFQNIKRQSAGLWENSRKVDSFKFSELADESCQLIQDVVIHEICSHQEPIGFDFISDIINDNSFAKVDIFSLNHDILLEKHLANKDISFIDGFDQPLGEVRPYNPDLLMKNHKIKIFKLHGSVDWNRFRITTDGNDIDFYGIPEHNDVDHIKDQKGDYLYTLSKRPTILTGTYNKIFDYGYGIFSDMHCFFHDIIRSHDRLIMSGYGWNDRGINTMLMDWIYSSMDKRLILLHEKPEQIRDESKSGMWARYDGFVQDGRIVPVRKWMCDTSLVDLKEIISR